MGQYYYIVNVSKKEYINPHDFGAGLKLMEFAYPGNPSTVTAALAVLLADGNNRGSGDLRSDHPIVGSWAFDRIVVSGDYADEHEMFGNVYRRAGEEFKNISEDILTALSDDGYFAEKYAKILTSEEYPWWMPEAVVRLAHKFTGEVPTDSDNCHIFFRNVFGSEASKVAADIAERFKL
jgi:hypothetical protein